MLITVLITLLGDLRGLQAGYKYTSKRLVSTMGLQVREGGGALRGIGTQGKLREAQGALGRSGVHSGT